MKFQRLTGEIVEKLLTNLKSTILNRSMNVTAPLKEPRKVS